MKISLNKINLKNYNMKIELSRYTFQDFVQILVTVNYYPKYILTHETADKKTLNSDCLKVHKRYNIDEKIIRGLLSTDIEIYKVYEILFIKKMKK